MMSCRRRYAGKPKDIFKNDYNELIISAKRKHDDEFYVFCSKIGEENWYSESCISICNDHIEHWKKENGKWSKKQ